MIRIGILGIGFMGTTHFAAIRNLPNAEVGAICTRDERKLTGDWRHIQGNFGGGGGIQDLAGIRTCTRIDEVLDDPDIDLVDVCLPTVLHHDIVQRALDAGKDVIVEKPIALRLDEADRMIRKAGEAGRTLMVAHVLKFFPEFAFLAQAIEDGRYGRLLGLHLKRVISKPLWGEGNWFDDYERTGAAGIDLHIHDTDFLRHLFGMPDSVHSAGMTSPNGYALYLNTQYGYADRDIMVSAQCGAISSAAFEHGYDAYFEEGTLWYNVLSDKPVTLYTPDGGNTEPEVDFPEAFEAQLGYAVDALEQRTEPALLSASAARDALRICHGETESAKTGKTVRFADQTGRNG